MIRLEEGGVGDRRARAPGARAGFGLLEILIAISIFAVAFGAVTTSLVTSTSLVHGRRESAIALDAAKSVLAQLKTSDFAQVWALYNDEPFDDPGGEGTAPGEGFAVEGLSPLFGDADGMCGTVEFPGNGVSLFENGSDHGFGTPRDLNGDGVVDTADHGADYVILPVRIRVDWVGQSGVQHLEFVTALTNQ